MDNNQNNPNNNSSNLPSVQPEVPPASVQNPDATAGSPTPIPPTPPIEETQSMPTSTMPSSSVIPIITTEEEPSPSSEPKIEIPTPQTTEVSNSSDSDTPTPISDQTSDDSEPKKSKKKIYTAIAGVVLLLVSIPLAIFLVQQNQEIRNKAAGSDAAHCAANDAKRYGPNNTVEANCSGWDQSNTSCQTDNVNSYYYSSCTPTGQAAHPDGCARPTDKVQCLDDTQKKEARNIGFNAVCYDGANPAESVLVSENRCGKPLSAGGSPQATITSVDVQPRNATKGQALTLTAASTGVGMIHVRIWPNDAPGVVAVDGGKISGGNGSISYDTNKLPAGTTTAKIRFQAQDSSGKDIGGVAKDIDVTISSGTSGIQVTNASVTPASPTLGQTVTFGATLTGGTGMIHVRIWPNDAPGVVAVDGGKIGVGQTSVTYDTGKLPKDTKTALVRFQAQDSSGKDIGGVAKDITVTFSQPVVGDSRCTQMEVLRGNSVIFTSDAGNVAPQIKVGDQLTFKVYCFTADAADDYDYFRISVTKPNGTTLTQDPVATRIQARDQGNNRFFVASYPLTADATGNYTVKAWGHTKKALWKGKD